MNDEREILYFKMQLLQAEIKMNGMIYENEKCKSKNIPIKYDETSFTKIIDEYSIHHNSFPFYKG